MIRRTVVALAILIGVAIAVGAGLVIGYRTKHGAAKSTPAATTSGESLLFAFDPQYEGRVLLARSDCNGDGRVIGAFRWTVAPGTEAQNYRIVVGPGDDTALLGS